jgi:D-glycero-D-manno-heptose 1,7-bisphosphate phosphatase
MNKAIFIDKDGTLIEDIPYNVEPSRITLQPNAIQGLKRLTDEGYLLIVVSNQSGVARGYFKEEDLSAVRKAIESRLARAQIRLADLFYCPHHPDGSVKEYARICGCRKPAPGMFYKAAEKFMIDLTQSWMIGDILHDVEAGNKAGCKTILIDNGNETEWLTNPERTPTLIASTINEAATFILNHQQHE